MAVSEKITCDVCGREKQQANHWVMFRMTQNGATITFAKWSQEDYEDWRSMQHACGMDCAVRALSAMPETWYPPEPPKER